MEALLRYLQESQASSIGWQKQGLILEILQDMSSCLLQHPSACLCVVQRMDFWQQGAMTQLPYHSHILMGRRYLPHLARLQFQYGCWAPWSSRKRSFEVSAWFPSHTFWP